MAIQHRRGTYNNFDPSRMVQGEAAIVLSGDPNTNDGKAAYIAFAPGNVKRLATINDIQDDLENAVDGVVDGATQTAQNAATRAETAASSAETTASELESSTTQISSNKQDIEDLNNFIINSTSYINGTFSIGGINTSTGKTNNVTTRARLSYTTVHTGKLYSLQFNNDEFTLLNAWLYTTNNDTGAIKNLTPDIKNGKYLNFSVGQNENFIRLTVKPVAGDIDITSDNLADITSATKLFELTDTSLNIMGVPADAYSTGQAILDTNSVVNKIKGLLPSYDIDWKKFRQEQSPLGWGIGYYNVDTGAGNSSSTNYIRTRNRLDTDLISENTVMCSVTPPTGYYVLVCVTEKSDNSFVETLNIDRTINKTITFMFDKTKRYGFTIGIFDGDGESYVNEQFLNSIRLTIFERAKSSNDYQPADLTREYIWDSNLEYALMLPTNYNSIGEPTKLIICGHGLSSTISANSWGAKNVSTKFVEQGYAVMDVNQVTTQDWCNPALIKKYITALKDITNKYNVTPMYVYGFSMGSLIGITLSTIIPGIKASVISGIRLDLLARYNEATPEEQAIIDTNLGFTDGFDYNKISGWCKTAFAYLTSDNELVNPVQLPPTLFLWGTSDTLTQSESLEKIDEIKRGGSICEVISYESATHGAMCLLSAGTSFNDAVDWFTTWR